MDKKIRLTAYTDAASFNNGMKVASLPEHSGSAGVILYDDVIIASISSFNPNSSISYGEMYAIHCVLAKVYDLAYKSNSFIELTLHSDSAYCVQSINDWMKSWKRNSSRGIWYKSSGEPVAYQEMLETIDKLLDNEYLKCRVKHISGHIDLSNEKDMNKAMKRYKRFNHEKVSHEQLVTHVIYNDICDRYAKRVLKLGMEGEIEYVGNNKVFKKHLT